ncbi:MAG: hypothetical protein IH840_04015 [Candidatus Heimdallarchaeota archaeon]|nr:hypothetical protein [Candidatus Heimdallarchaeota archaeon]
MKSLSKHYHKMRKKYPDEKIMLVFDIDDTIVDISIPLLYVLKKYDYINRTAHFRGMTQKDMVFEEWHIQDWLPDIIRDTAEQEKIVQFVRANMWLEDTILMSHRPFQGVLEIIRWFQIQANTYVGLNTGRSDSLRKITLDSLNLLGSKFRVSFSSDILYMNPMEDKVEEDIRSYKSRGLLYFQKKGYKVISFADNEPANLKVIDDVLLDPEIRLLHADTSLDPPGAYLPSRQ